MARGWDSKAIESQQDDAAQPKKQRPELTPAERDRAARRAGLELALTRTQAQVGAACRPAHREMLSLQLQAIKAQLDSLS